MEGGRGVSLDSAICKALFSELADAVIIFNGHIYSHSLTVIDGLRKELGLEVQHNCGNCPYGNDFSCLDGLLAYNSLIL